MDPIEVPSASAFDVPEKKSGSGIRANEHSALMVSVSECRSDQQALRRIVSATPWRLATAGTCRRALEILSNAGVGAVFCDSLLPDGTWKDLLDAVSRLDAAPLLVVTSRLADELLWAEVLNLGGYDVIVKPYRAVEVREALASIWIQRTMPHLSRTGQAVS